MSTWMIVPSDYDLEHGFHKYIDKVMGPNGKWRYIYEKVKTGVNRAIGLDKRKKLEKAARNYYVAEGTKKYLQDERNKIHKAKHIKKETRKQAEDSITATIAANNENLQKHKNKFEKAKEAYKKTLAGSIENVIVEGKNAFNKIVSLFKKTPKATVTNNTKGITYQYSPKYGNAKSGLVGSTNKSTNKGTYYNPGSTTKSKSTTTSTTKSTNTTSTSKRKPNVIKTTNTDSRDRNYNKQGNLTAYGQLSGSGWKKKKLKKK